MKALISSDLHFTSSSADEYRWELFDFLKKQINTHSVECVLLLGDITDAKDRHPSELVSRVIDALRDLALHAKVFILKGNHDYYDESKPFFLFLKHFTNIEFIANPTEMGIQGSNVLFLPSTRAPETAWSEYDFNEYDYIFTHQTYNKSVASNGTQLEGVSDKIFANANATVISGDIHVPQKLNHVEYVGSPYRIKFGDTFTPRIILLEDHKITTIKTRFKKKRVIELDDWRDIKLCKIYKSNIIKIKLSLSQEQHADIDRIKERLRTYVNKRGAVVHSIDCTSPYVLQKASKNKVVVSPEQALRSFAKNQKLDRHTFETGKEVLHAILHTDV